MTQETSMDQVQGLMNMLMGNKTPANVQQFFTEPAADVCPTCQASVERLPNRQFKRHTRHLGGNRTAVCFGE